MKNLALLVFFALLGAHPRAQAAAIDLSNITVLQRYSGILELKDQNAFKSVNDLKPYRRRTLDISTVEAELELKLNPISKFEFEVEFEHGGTGSTVEFDPMEEFGEFESENERGGEVAIEEIFYQRKLTPRTEIIVGKAPVYMSLSAVLRKPLMYHSAAASSLEERMIPTDWAEPGVQVLQRFSDFTARAGVVSGLNSEFMRKYNWIGGGEQTQFENVTFDDPAYYGSLEFGDVGQGRGVALGYYTGNTTDNRRKKDKVSKRSEVRLWTAMGQWRWWRLGLKAEALRGELQNAEDLANANATLGGLARPKNFASLGSKALLDTVQVNYEFVDGWTAFAQYNHVNTFSKVQGSIFADPRYDVRQTGYGVSHRWDDICGVKFETFREWTHLANAPTTTTYIVQFVFDTGDF